MRTQNMQTFLVIGTDHHNTLGVVESLGQKGIKPDVIITKSDGSPSSFVLTSKYINNGYVCHVEDVVRFVKEEYPRSKEGKAIVVTTSDTTAATLDDYYDELSKFLVLPGTGKEGELRYWMSKKNMMALAVKVGLNVPKTIVVKKGERAENVTFPCMTKSISSLLGGKSNISVCFNQKELDAFLENQKKYPGIQVQQLIDKDFEFQFLGYSLESGEEIIIPGRTHIDRPKGFDNTFYLKFLEIDESFNNTLAKAKDFIRQTHYSGPFSIEFIRDKKGVDYFLEMNFRNDGNAICMTASGTNTPYIWYLYNTGGDYKKEMEQSTFTPVTMMPEEPYFFNMLRREVTIGEWLRNIRNTTQFATYFKEDNKPFKTYLKMEIGKYVSKYFKKLFIRVWEPVFVTPKEGTSLIEGKWHYQYLKNKPKDRCYADPFVLKVTDEEIHLLVEEIRNKFPTGRIAKLIIDRTTFSIKNEIVLLDLETHLSFPAILRKGSEIYVYPENAASGGLNMYRYIPTDERFERVCQLSDQPISDAVIYEGFSKPCILCTRKPKSNGNETEFYEADKPEGPYSYKTSVQFVDNVGRGAGDIFELDDKLIRPAQVNNRDYGEALCFQELNKTEIGYSLTELSRIQTPRWTTGLHTFNSYKGVNVVDIRKPLHPFIYYTARFFYRLFKRRK